MHEEILGAVSKIQMIPCVICLR